MIFQVRDMFSECGGLGQEKKTYVTQVVIQKYNDVR